MGREIHPDDVVARLAGRQLGLITRKQLLEARVTPRGIERRIAAGRLHRVHRGVYLVGHAVMAPDARYLAAVLACGDGSVVSHVSAGELWLLLPRTERVVDVSVTARRGLAIAGIVIHRPRHLDARDVTHLGPIPLTSPARTLLDLAECGDSRRLEIAWHEAHNRHLVSRREIAELLDRSPGRHGIGSLRALLEQATGSKLSRSKKEDLLLALVRSAGLPEPEMNVMVGNYRPDFLWRERRLIVEVDGGDWHASREARARDHRRDSNLRNAGWKVERFTDRELEHEPTAVVARLTRALYA